MEPTVDEQDGDSPKPPPVSSQHSLPMVQLRKRWANILADSAHSPSSNLVLYLGCDNNEDEEEQLRNVKDNSEHNLSPISPKLKLPKFTLTPVVARKESEDSTVLWDLTTPCQSLSKSVDCPERPSKTHRTSTSQCENSTASCRLLFSGAVVSSPPAIEEKDDSNDHRHRALVSASQECTPPRPKDRPLPLSTSAKQALLFKGDADDLPTPIHSPTSSSSSCSDCIECSSSSVSSSPVIASLFPFSSPVLFHLKPAKQTIISGEEVPGQVPDVEEALEVPIAGGFQEIPQERDGKSVEDLQPRYTLQDSSKDVKESGKDAPATTMDEMEVVEKEECPAAVQIQNEHMETSFAPSSTGSVHSNWTAISGISPLPSSDPIHLRYYRHHHHRHHHHHHHGPHHHHHHHRHHSDGKTRNKDQDASGYGDMITSTPIHQKHVVEMVNVSSVTTSQEVFSEPKFIMSSELMSPELSFDVGQEMSEKGMYYSVLPTTTSHNDMEYLETCPDPMSVPVPVQSALSPNTVLENTQLKRSRQFSNEETERNKGGDKQGNMKEEMEQSNKKTKGEEKTNEEEGGLLNSPVQKKPVHRSLFYGRQAQGRPLSKAEARTLIAAHVNFSDKYLIPEERPSSSHCHSSTFDESLFRSVYVNPKLSVTKE